MTSKSIETGYGLEDAIYYRHLKEEGPSLSHVYIDRGLYINLEFNGNISLSGEYNETLCEEVECTDWTVTLRNNKKAIVISTAVVNETTISIFLMQIVVM